MSANLLGYTISSDLTDDFARRDDVRMSHMIEISDELYAKIATYAKNQGQSVESVAQLCLSAGVQTVVPTECKQEFVYDPSNDPLAPFIGAIDSGDDDPGWIELHDEYFAGVSEFTERGEDGR